MRAAQHASTEPHVTPEVTLLRPWHGTPALQLSREVRLQTCHFWRHPLAAAATLGLPVVLLPLLNALYPDLTVLLDTVSTPEATATYLISLERYLVPTLAAFGIATACYANLGLRLSLARAQGVLARVKVSPLHPLTYLSGWIGASLITGLAVGAVTAITGWLLYGVTPDADKVAVTLLVILAGSACFCALGLATAAAVPSPQTAPAVVLAVLLPLAVLSNVFYLPGQAPQWLGALGELLPLEPFRASLTSTFSPTGGGLATHATNLAVLGAWTLAGTLASLFSFTWLPRR